MRSALCYDSVRVSTAGKGVPRLRGAVFMLEFTFFFLVTDDHPDLTALVPVAAAHHRTDCVIHHGNCSDLIVLHRPGNTCVNVLSVNELHSKANC